MELLIIAILTVLNGFFALSEIALVSVKKARMESLAEEGDARAKIVLKLLENPENFLSSVQVGITLIGIISGAYGWAALAGSIESWLKPVTFLAPHASIVSFALAIGGITYFSIVIWELVPKSIAMKYSEPIALGCVPTLRYFMILTHPFVTLLSSSTSIILKLLRIDTDIEGKISEDELVSMLRTAWNQGTIETEEADVHQKLFSFSDLTAKSLMVHRSEIEYVDVNDTKKSVLDTLTVSPHSKFVVVDDTLDTVVGIIKLRDFLEIYDSNIPLKNAVSKPIFVSESTPAFIIMNTFRKKKQHFAIVVDEYGGTSGIVTLHDLIEAIVGHLPDEDDESEPDIIERKDGSLLVSGRTPIHEFNSYFEREIIEENGAKYATLAGYLIGYAGRMPRVSDRYEIEKVSYEIVDMDGVRIDKVIVRFLTEEDVLRNENLEV
jgi:putative hemolysin